MKGKYMVELEKMKKIFVCQPTQLKDYVKESFRLQKSFHLQMYDEDFGEWADVTDFGALPSRCKLKVKKGKKTVCSCRRFRLLLGLTINNHYLIETN